MKQGQPGTESKDGPLTPQMIEQTSAMPADESLEDESAGNQLTSMLQISPKWQVVLIGGAFIVINLIVMVLFVVALILRH